MFFLFWKGNKIDTFNTTNTDFFKNGLLGRIRFVQRRNRIRKRMWTNSRNNEHEMTWKECVVHWKFPHQICQHHTKPLLIKIKRGVGEQTNNDDGPYVQSIICRQRWLWQRPLEPYATHSKFCCCFVESDTKGILRNLFIVE